jgi:hypothetical protein
MGRILELETDITKPEPPLNEYFAKGKAHAINAQQAD